MEQEADLPRGCDVENLAEVALAFLYLKLHKDGRNHRAWKGLDWDVMQLLHEKGWISDPKNKYRSVVLSDEAAALAEKMFVKHFGGDQG